MTMGSLGIDPTGGIFVRTIFKIHVAHPWPENQAC